VPGSHHRSGRPFGGALRQPWLLRLVVVLDAEGGGEERPLGARDPADARGLQTDMVGPGAQVLTRHCCDLV